MGLGEGLTSIYYVFFMSKIKVTCKKMLSTHFVDNYLSQSFHM